MLKLFFKFYLVIALPMVFLFVPALNPTYTLVEHWATAMYDKEYNGVFYLLERELHTLPEDRWQDRIDELNLHFGYQVALQPLDELPLAQSKIQRIAHHETVLELGRISRLYKRVRNTGSVLILFLDSSMDDEADYAVRGAVYLLNRMLVDVPVQTWNKRLQALSEHSGVTVQVTEKSRAPVVVAKNSRLEQGRAIHVEEDENVLSIYAPTADPELLYKFGPVDERDFRRRVDSLNRIVPATLLAIGIFILAWPLYRDIRELRRAAASFGRGELETTVRLGPGASLGPLAIAFNTMTTSIRNLIKSHKDLTNSVSHELKTPVTRLRFSLEMLRENSAEADRLRYLTNMENDLGELEKLIGELLDHARYDRSAVSAQFEKIEIGQWIGERIQPYQSCSRNIDVAFHLKDQSPCRVHLDKSAMEKAVNNLLSNALHYADRKVSVTLDCGENEVTLRVEDDGPGVGEQDRKRIFEPFVRIDGSRHRTTGGSGLGLAIVRQVAKMHGGTVDCDSSSLGGACITLQWKKTREGV